MTTGHANMTSITSGTPATNHLRQPAQAPKSDLALGATAWGVAGATGFAAIGAGLATLFDELPLVRGMGTTAVLGGVAIAACIVGQNLLGLHHLGSKN